MTAEPWFRTEKSGLAAHPVNWKGWAAIGVYAAAVLLLTILMFGFLPVSGVNVIVYITVVLTFTVALVMLALRKTDGGWAWSRKQK